MADRDTLIAVLKQTGRRLRRNRALGLAMFAAVGVVGAVAVAQFLEGVQAARRGPSGHSLTVTVLLVAVGFAAIAVWSLMQASRVTLERAAAEADARAGLDDTLKSALWFSRDAAPTPWIAMLLSRAAAAARSLDPARLIPFVVPRGLRVAAVSVIVLLVVARVAPALVPASDAIAASQAAAASRTDDVALLRDLADQAERAGDAATADKLRKLLAALQDPAASAADRQRALAAARAALDQRGLEAGASLESLRQLADNLGNRDDLREVAEALRQGDVAKAAEALKKVAAARGEKSDEAAKTSVGAEKSIAEELKDAIQSSAPGAGEDKGGETQGKLAKAVQGLQELAQKLDVQQQANQAGRKLDALSMSLSRQSALSAARYGQSQGVPNSGESPDTGNASIKGGTLYRLGAVAKEKQAGQREGGRAGDSSGNNQGEPVVGDEIARIDAKYQLEALRGRDADAPDGPDEKFYAASRAGDAKTAFANVTPSYRHAAEEPMAAERIALRHRSIVKQYFSQVQEQPPK